MAIYKDLNDYEVMYLVEEQDENAKNILFEKYQPVVVAIASQYKKEAIRCGLELDDLIQEGFVGLYSAMQNYNSTINVKFYTYATISIRGKILNYLSSKNRYKYAHLNQSISLSNMVSSDSQFSLWDVLENKEALQPHLEVENRELEKQIHQFLLSLQSPQSFIFELKLNGFGNSDISALLDLPLKYVANILFRLRRELRTYLLKY